MENVPALASRTTSFSSSSTSLPTPADFGVLGFGIERHDNRNPAPNGKVKRMVSSFFKTKKRKDDDVSCEPVPEVKETGGMRKKWRTIVASMRR